MSSGGLLTAAQAVAVAAAGGLVLAEAAAAVLTVRAAAPADESAPAPSAPSAPSAPQSAAEGALAAWEPVVAAVVELNARIRMLTVRALRAGVGVDLPKPLDLTGHTRLKAERWVSDAGARLVGARATLRDAAENGEIRLAQRPGHAEALAGYQRALRKRDTPHPTPVAAILITLDEDANEREHLEALSAAAAISPDVSEPVYLDAFRARIADINAAVARRRLAARYLAALEEPVVAAAGAPGAFLDTAARLAAVLSGDEDLTADLRAEATEAVAWAAAVTRSRFVRDLMSDCLTELGYTPAADLDARYAPEFAVCGITLRLARPRWNDEHSAEVWVDQQGTVHGRVVREREADDLAARELERRTDFDIDLRTLGHRLGADVVTDEGYFPQGHRP